MAAISILVVDDDPVVCRLVARFVEAGGYEATAVDDPREALEVFEQRAFDLVVTDLRMPGLSGVDLARSMSARRPEVPICLISGHTFDLLPEELSLFAATFEKPFGKEDFLEVVGGLLSRPRGVREQVDRPPRFAADWRVDYIPLDAGLLAARGAAPRRAVLKDISEQGLSFITDDPSTDDRFCAFLIYPPGCEQPSLMVGEVRWTKKHASGRLAGTRQIFWGSKREMDLAVSSAR